MWCGGGVLAKSRDGYTAMGWPPGFGLVGPQRMKLFTRDPSWLLQRRAIRWGGWQGFEVLSLAGYKYVPMPASSSCSGDCALAEGLWDSSVPSALAQRCHVPVSRAGAAPQQRRGLAELGVVATAIASLSTRGRFVCFQGCCNPGAGFLGMIAYQKGCNCVRVQDV